MDFYVLTAIIIRITLLWGVIPYSFIWIAQNISKLISYPLHCDT